MLAVNKRADDRLDYDVKFEKWVSDDDTITGAEAQASIKSTDPDAVTDLTIDSVQVFGLTVKLWLSGGTSGATYAVLVTASTGQGRVKEEKFVIRIKDC
jgi:hypothetical protein